MSQFTLLSPVVHPSRDGYVNPSTSFFARRLRNENEEILEKGEKYEMRAINYTHARINTYTGSYMYEPLHGG